MTELAVNNLSVAISRLIQGEFLDSDQPDEISYANKIQKEDSTFNWDLDVVTIFNRIRALSTWPVARTNLLGEDIKIIDAKKRDFARGLSSFSSEEIEKIKGYHSNEIQKILGYVSKSEVVHKDDMVEI